MVHFLLVIMLHILPFLLLMIPFLLLFDVSLKRSKKAVSDIVQKQKPDIGELEEKLNKLIENNKTNLKINELHEELTKSRTNTVSGYIKLNKKDLKGFHLFQLIFTMIKNNAEDKKIIKVLRHYLPSCSTSHLYALLHSFKVFLNISHTDGKQKELLNDLNQNHVRTTLLYLEKKLNLALNRVVLSPPAMQQMVINQAVVYGLVFAAFAEFYDNEATEKILRLAGELSPKLFKYWHQVPREYASKNYPPVYHPLKTFFEYTKTNNRLN